MTQRSDEDIATSRASYLAGLSIVEVPVPKATQTEEINLEVLLDIRETMNKILVLLGGTP